MGACSTSGGIAASSKHTQCYSTSFVFMRVQYVVQNAQVLDPSTMALMMLKQANVGVLQ